MILLFEEYRYPEETIQPFSDSLQHLYSRDKGGKIFFDCVGYCLCKDRQDVVFILPKVLIKNDGGNSLAFGKEIAPEDLIEFDKQCDLLDSTDRDFIARLAVWLYRAIYKYALRQQDTKAVISSEIADVLTSRQERDTHFCTYLDIILQLFRFHKEHSQLFTFVTLSRSGGNKNINWNRTIARNTPLLVDGLPIYERLETRVKDINFDDRLIVLFYSVLIYLREKYHFDVRMTLNYNLLSSGEIERMIQSGKGTRYLRSIRKNYFKDELVTLWKLLFIFFDKAEKIKSGRYHSENLLLRNFNIVFEDMIDALLSDESQSIPQILQSQPDGKLIDHIYSDISLTGPGEIYYIGDSKYYQDRHDVGLPSVYKQFTYAKNVIQFNVGLLDGDNPLPNGKRYRDSETEGYNITPNFFIRGDVDFEQLNGENDNLRHVEEETHFMSHFPNRLFDRDTLLIQTYNINFLYVLEAYISRGGNEAFCKKARKAFRDDLLKRLNDKYDFYLISFNSMEEVKQFVQNNFKQLIGKMYRISDESTDILLAFEKHLNTDDGPNAVGKEPCKAFIKLEDGIPLKSATANIEQS